jgi:oxygen-independent coproporphyrinogen-3 oxidase
MKSLEKQLQNELEKHLKKGVDFLETVFIGGGTPSCIKYEKYNNLFYILQPYLQKDTEITTEANPNSATYEWLKGMKAMGVNRISFGIQSFDDEKLKFLGRAHNKEVAINAIQNAKKINFDSINCDIIYGVQNDTLESLKKDYDILNTLGVEHLSTYSLTIEEGTKFYNMSQVKMDDESLSYEIFEYLHALGFKQYEISNFAKQPQFQSKHNFGYWQHKNYLGVGAGAVGFVKNKRYYPQKDLQKYIQTPLNHDTETLSLNDIKVEKVLLGFRSILGVEKKLFDQNEHQKIHILLEEKKLLEDAHKIYNPNFLLADELALYIMN